MKSSVNAPSARTWREWGSLLGLAVGTTLVFFYRAVFSDEIFISRDIQRVYYPLRLYWAERVRNGEFPDWFPYDGLGQPYVGMVISGAFHPGNLLGLVLPISTALKVNTLLCYPVAVGGVFHLSRRLGLERGPAILAGLLFAFCGYMICITNNLLYLMAAATFPWALWGSDSFFAQPTILKATRAALLSTLVLLAGDSQSFVVCMGLTCLLFIYRHQPGRGRREFAATACLLGMTALMSSVQILPALQVLRVGQPVKQSLAAAMIWSLHPARLLEMALGPIFSGDAGDDAGFEISKKFLKEGMATLWVDSVHVGAAALACALVAVWFHRRNRKTWFPMACGVMFLVLCLGRYGGLYELLFNALPLWRPFRYPEKLLPYFFLFVCIAAAEGVQLLHRHEHLRRRVGLLLIFSGCAIGGLYLVESQFRWLTNRLATLWDGVPSQEALERLHVALLLQSALTTVTLVAFGVVWVAIRRTELRAALAPALLVAQLFVANEPLYELTVPEVIETPSAFVSTIERQEGSRRLGRPRVISAVEQYSLPQLQGMSYVDRFAASVAMALEPDTPAIWGLESSNGYLPGASHRVTELNEKGRIWWTRYIALFGTGYLTMSARTYESIGGKKDIVVAEHPALKLVMLRIPTAKPRVYLTRPRCVATTSEVMALLRSTQFVSEREALVECETTERAAESDVAMGTATMVSYAPERVEVSVDAREGALLVLNDALYSGWSATVDGVSTPILATNYAVRGVRVPAGVHTVIFSYRSPGLILGAVVSLLTLFVGLGVGLWGRRFPLKQRVQIAS